MIDFTNINTLWASVLVETLFRLGLTTAIISPGSRSTPLTVAFARHQTIESIPILDERSASFFALGIAKKSHFPVALVCTSGTAGANFYPAIIEAKYSGIPLLILTADRPPELRNCHAPQTINQLNLYGNYPNWHTELLTPSIDLILLPYLRQNLIQAIKKCLFPTPGVVHLNVPFREPLAPIPQPQISHLKSHLQIEDFFSAIYPQSIINSQFSLANSLLQKWQKCQRGIIIAGRTNPLNPKEYCQSIAQLSLFLGWAVIADVLSPIRNYLELNSYLISTYDLILRNTENAQQLVPEIVIQIGELPISKNLGSWLVNGQAKHFIINESYENIDSLHGKTIHLPIAIEKLNLPKQKQKESNYLQRWCNLEIKTRQIIKQTMERIDHFFEGKISWLLSQNLPSETPIFIANSMSVRYAEFFWMPNNRKILPYVNRGANGIDGTLSTALGMAYRHQSSLLLTGDLALLHDTNGFLITKKFQGHLTIILINNEGGGIFEILPIAKFEPPFEEFFATPQNINFAQLSATYGIEYHLINCWEELTLLLNPLPTSGIRLLEIQTDRKADALWLENNLSKISK